MVVVNLRQNELQKNCPDIEILNPDLHIATLNDGAKLTMEVRFGFGKGYVPAMKQNIADQTIGIVPIDSIFTPIENVRYDIENVRIGESNEYEKLTLEVDYRWISNSRRSYVRCWSNSEGSY